jgi:hypothetical protein
MENTERIETVKKQKIFLQQDMPNKVAQSILFRKKTPELEWRILSAL